MAKSAKSRHKAEKLRTKWARILQALDPERSTECLSFGRIFSRDPFDCGKPGCALCSYEKVLHRKARRQVARNAERGAEVELTIIREGACD